MSIDPQRLRALSQLLLGTAFSPEQCARLAKTLSVTEEVLPWLQLRQNAFKSFPQLEANLIAAANKCPFPSSKRERTRVRSRKTLDLNRALDEAIAAVVSNNISHAGLAVKADATLTEIIRFREFDGRSDSNSRAVSYL